MSLEQEIKLALTDDKELDLKSLSWLEPFIDNEIQSTRLVSDYFDTPQLHLIKSGFGLRLRNDSGSWWQTVKATGQVVDGLHRRQEWEWALSEAQFDLDLLRQTPLQAAIDEPRLWSQVDKIFTTDFQRQAIQLKLDDKTEVEFAYDRGRVYSKDREAVIHEVELEFKSGSLESMKKLAELFFSKLSVQYNQSSKAKIGYELIS
jgi:triphosphatase